MDCRRIEDRIDAFLNGTTDAGETARIREHLAACPGCRRLEKLLRGGTDLPDLAMPDGFADSVLARSGVSPCGRSRDLLAGHVDDTLEPVDAELMLLHLESCDGCAALAGALARMKADLPALAEVPPDDRFVADVLAATSSRHRVSGRLANWWWGLVEGLARRPRMAMEGAYLATVLLVLLFGTPLSPFRDVPSKAVAAVHGGWDEPVLQPALARIDAGVSERSAHVWGAARSAVTESYGDARQEIRGRIRNAGEVTLDARRKGSRIGRLARNGDLEEIWRQIRGSRSVHEPMETTERSKEEE